jgi:hypothetical protein
MADVGIVPEEGGGDGDAEEFIVFGVVSADFEDTGAESRVVTTLLVKEGIPIGAGQVEQAVGEGADAFPLLG